MAIKYTFVNEGVPLSYAFFLEHPIYQVKIEKENVKSYEKYLSFK